MLPNTTFHSLASTVQAITLQRLAPSTCLNVCFPASGDEENLLQLSAATINAEWLVGSMLGQSCQGNCASGSCSACRAAAADCSEHKQPAEGSNVQKSKVCLLTLLGQRVFSCLFVFFYLPFTDSKYHNAQVCHIKMFIRIL